MDRSPAVAAWVKNDHLGFVIMYAHKGAVRKYSPDFIVRLNNGAHLILETKGQDNELARSKREYLREWVEASFLEPRKIGVFGSRCVTTA